MFRFIYSLFLFIVYPLYYFVSLFHKKLKSFRISRKEGLGALKNYLDKNADNKQTIVWLHGSSVGEIDQALALFRVIKKKHNKIKIILSTFSLSSKIKKIKGIDLYFYIPLDFKSSWSSLFQNRTPDLFITMTWDVFPNLLHVLNQKNQKSYLCSASISPNNWRLKPFFSKMISPLYLSLSGIGCVNKNNHDRYLRLCNKKDIVKITGDSRFDTILDRISKVSLNENHIKWWKDFKKRNDQVLILASTYSECESIIIPLIPELLNKFKNLKVVIFPHKVEESRLEEIQNSLSFHEIASQRFSEKKLNKNTKVSVMDVMGLLALSYKYSDYCYVGGGFRQRVHNTAEPAALGNVIVTGPNIDWSGIALELENIKVLKRCQDQSEINKAFTALLQNPAITKKSGSKAASYIKTNAGSSLKFYNEFLKEKINSL